MDGCGTLYNNLSLNFTVSKSKFQKCAAVSMQPEHLSLKRSPSNTPPLPSSHQSQEGYSNNAPRAMPPTLLAQNMPVSYQHYPRDAFHNEPRGHSYSHYNVEDFPHYQYTSSGWSTPVNDFVQNPINLPSAPLPMARYTPTQTPLYPSTSWPTSSTSGATETTGLASVDYPYVAETSPAVYNDQYVPGYTVSRHSSVGTNHPHPSPYAGSIQLSPPPHTPENYERHTPSPHEPGQPTSTLLQPQLANQQYYTHKEQLQFFREALSLPFTVSPSPFIPQMMYKPHTNSDRRRYVEEVELDPPIYFWAEHPSECGISLADALHSRVRRMVGREDTVFEGRGPSVSIRLEWPGYRQWSRQIPTKDFRTPPGPITKAKLAKNVAKCVQRFILERQSQRLEDESDEKWRVGTTSGSIRLEDLVLVSMHHVSMGSWQPQLRVCRSSQPRHLGNTHW